MSHCQPMTLSDTVVVFLCLRRWAQGACHLYSAQRPSRWALAHILVMVALRNSADHYIFILSFVLSSSSSFFFSSTNLSRRRLDVCYTSTHGVALVRISDAGLKPAARGSLKNTGRKKVAKNRHLGTIAQLCRAISSQLRHVSTMGKKLVKQQCPPHVPTIWWTSAH